MTEAPIQIRNPHVIRDIRALAERLDRPITEVVAEAVRRRLAEEEAQDQDGQAARRRRLADILTRIDALPRLGPRLSDSDFFDSEGFPR
jgi:hypothetical protein